MYFTGSAIQKLMMAISPMQFSCYDAVYPVCQGDCPPGATCVPQIHICVCVCKYIFSILNIMHYKIFKNVDVNN